jgi:hypothetical protein
MRKTLMVFAVLAGCTHEAHNDAQLSVPDATLEVQMNSSATLDVLADATGVESGYTIAISAPPSHGSASLQGEVLSFAPATDYIGADSLDFIVTTPANGATAKATVAITVGCSTCAIGSTITLSWNANAASDMVLGYRVYFATTDDTSALMKVDDLSVSDPSFDASAPTASYDAWAKLMLDLGDQACFAITAYNANGESGFSNVACLTVTRGAMRVGV